ncbi:Transcriptional regulator, TetR family [uncultured Eubacteriales bacterium]|uniref:Transcriptional regulator, TetR family n=1 Tax=uncultured Eubacteriales bacterium TaxID=172733 RepID=A0A212JA92_9FIRM|nr:Transcriptional regulator, TetR family [uncultured Eubacteriales bacterium]
MEYSERRRLQALETEQAILKATVDLAREKGFDRVSIRAICARAGITTGAFYHHFPSKEALLARGFAPLDAYMEALMTGNEGEPPLERLWVLLSGYAGFMEGMGWKLVARYYVHRLSAPSFASMDPTRFTLRSMLECLAAIQAEGGLVPSVTAEWAADFLFRHFRGVVVDWVLHQGAYPLLPKLEQDYRFFQQSLEQTAERDST